MKTVKLLFFTAACAALTASCGKNETPDNNGLVAVKLGTQSATRASGDTWTAGDKIGVWMLDAANATVDGYANKEYAASSTGTSTSFTASADMYYPMDGSPVGFAAYYPYYSGVAGTTLPIDISDQSAPADIDLLWVKTGASYSKTDPTVALRFEHMLSKMIIVAVAGPGVDAGDLAGMRVDIEGMEAEAQFNLITGSISGIGTLYLTSPYIVTDGHKYEAIMFPGEIPAGKIDIYFVIHPGTAAEETFTWNVPATEMERGKEHEWTVTLSRTEVKGIAGTILDWLVSNGGTGTAS